MKQIKTLFGENVSWPFFPNCFNWALFSCLHIIYNNTYIHLICSCMYECIYIYEYTHTHTHTHTYVYIYMYIFIYSYAKVPNNYFFEYLNLKLLLKSDFVCSISKFGDCSWGSSEGSLFNRNYTEVERSAQLLSLDCSTLLMICILSC